MSALLTATVLAMTGCAKLTAPAREESAAVQPAAKPAASAKPSPAPRPTAPPTAGDQEKVAASHILIGYKGAMRAKADRTKEEAKKIANELAARAKKGEDFAELAKKNSEGPSAVRGGQLNQFTRRQMVKPFSDAAFALKVGQVSDPVETPFGFHIIKRTK
jgi:peptidyl-prolyl cis-trans isomerase C/peptidyl-prolyl cis-trans isomerase SurA